MKYTIEVKKGVEINKIEGYTQPTRDSHFIKWYLKCVSIPHKDLIISRYLPESISRFMVDIGIIESVIHCQTDETDIAVTCDYRTQKSGIWHKEIKVYLPKDICEKIIKNLTKKNLTKILWLKKI
jgi:hypothetical protein